MVEVGVEAGEGGLEKGGQEYRYQEERTQHQSGEEDGGSSSVPFRLY